MAVGDRLIQLMRLIAVSRGFKKEDDMDASERILGDAGAGPAAGRALKPHLSKMLDEYYELVGWDSSTGVPSADKLERLGLAEMVPVLKISP